MQRACPPTRPSGCQHLEIRASVRHYWVSLEQNTRKKIARQHFVYGIAAKQTRHVFCGTADASVPNRSFFRRVAVWEPSSKMGLLFMVWPPFGGSKKWNLEKYENNFHQVNQLKMHVVLKHVLLGICFLPWEKCTLQKCMFSKWAPSI